MIITNTDAELVSLQWTVVEDGYTYMDTYTYTKAEYEALTPEELLTRQTAQYQEWRAYMENPQG